MRTILFFLISYCLTAHAMDGATSEKISWRVLQRALRARQVLHEVPGTFKCYSGSYAENVVEQFCSHGVCVPVYSYESRAAQKFNMGFESFFITACRFHTANGLMCNTDRDGTDCRTKDNVVTILKGSKLVPYVIPKYDDYLRSYDPGVSCSGFQCVERCGSYTCKEVPAP